MFSSALKSLTSPISANYSLSPTPVSASGPWIVFDAKRKQTGKPVSIFVFDKKSLDPPSGSLGLGGRGNNASLKRAHEEVIDRLKREVGSLARLRHPSILELVEPVEETRAGGLMFATEPVTASLAGLLRDRDEQERTGGVGGRGSRFVVEEADGTRHRRELEMDELEIQKGLLQLGKGLEFLHESAGLVHGNLTPEAVLVNGKGDWKIGGLGFCGPYESAAASAVAPTTTMPPISLSEVLSHDPRLPRVVQLNLDYTSPDFVLDNTLAPAADLFSLGLLILALYNTPHVSPFATSNSLSTYKRLSSSSATLPSQSNNFLIPASRPLPPSLLSDLLPRLLARRPAQRPTARALQQAPFFDNILVSTIRFLDALPAKSPREKAAFLRGLPRILPQFPATVLERKVLPALLDELKDRDLLAPLLSNAFAIVHALPTGKRAFTTVLAPKLRDLFLTHRTAERDASGEAGLMVVLEHLPRTTAEYSDGKIFREELLPIVLLALESATHGVQDAALSVLPAVLPVLDFTTIKGELFPVVAAVFAKTSSLAIKIKGLDAFYTLCGGTSRDDTGLDDDLNGLSSSSSYQHNTTSNTTSTSSSSAVLDKFTIQDKIVPLLKGIKTREPGVMIVALRVLRQIGGVVDAEFAALELLPVLWGMALGPLLDLRQFEIFMREIKRVGSRVEGERIRRLTELGGGGAGIVGSSGAVGRGIVAGGALGGVGGTNGGTNGDEADFEMLVSGGSSRGKALTNGMLNHNDNNNGGDLMDNLGPGYPSSTAPTPTFAWQTPPTPAAASMVSASRQQIPSLQPPPRHQQQSLRSITPDQALSSFTALTPASPFSQPLQPQRVQPQPARSSGAPPIRHGVPALSMRAQQNTGPNGFTAAQVSSGQGLQPRPPANSGVTGLPAGQLQKKEGGMERYESLL